MEMEDILTPRIELNLTIDAIGVGLVLENPEEFSFVPGSPCGWHPTRQTVNVRFAANEENKALDYLENLAMKLRPAGSSYTRCYGDVLRVITDAVDAVRDHGSWSWFHHAFTGKYATIELTLCRLTEERLGDYLRGRFEVTKKHRFEFQFRAMDMRGDMGYRVCGDVGTIYVDEVLVPLWYQLSTDVKASIPFHPKAVEVSVLADLGGFGIDRKMTVGTFVPSMGDKVRPARRRVDQNWFTIGYEVVVVQKGEEIGNA